LVLAIGTAALGSDAFAQTVIDGVFRYVGGAAQKQQVRSAIAAATANLPRRERLRLASRLEVIAAPLAEIMLDAEGENLIMVVRPGRELQSPADNSAVQVRSDLSLRQHMEAGVLVQELISSDLTQLYRYSLSGDGNTLTVAARLSAPGVEPVVYQLTYARR
jgi:hypothetical protein